MNKPKILLTDQKSDQTKILDQRRIYPLRPSAEVEQEILEIEAILAGKHESIALSSLEKEKLLEWENELGEELEKIHELKMRTDTFFPGYFLTAPGRADWERLFPGQNCPTEEREIEDFLYAHRQGLAEADEKFLDEVSSRSTKLADLNLEEQFLSAMREDGALFWNELVYPQRVGIILDPEVALEKLNKLLNIKKRLKKVIKDGKLPEANSLSIASAEISKMYLARVNELLANHYGLLLKLQRKVEVLGLENLNDAERALLEKVKGKKNLTRTLTTLDKFVFGTGVERDPSGDYQQIPLQIKARVDAVIEAQSDFAKAQSDGMSSMGLSPEKVLTPHVTAEVRMSWGKRVLAAYGLLSEESEETYVKSRKTAAGDGKWQFVTRIDRKSKAVNPQQKAVLDHDGVEDVVRALFVTCGHEIEGHVLQQLNKEKIPLRLFKKLGGDRKQLMSEGGAVFNEETLIQSNLGYQRPIATYYLLAMEVKKQGGDFAECLNSAYQVELSKLRAKFDLSNEDQYKQFLVQAKKILRDLIPKVKRIFVGVSLSDRSGLIPETKDTVYLEQEIMMKKLAEKGLTKLAYIGGMNLKNIAVLLRLGILSFDQIEEPRMITQEIWNEIKDSYKSSAGISNSPGMT